MFAMDWRGGWKTTAITTFILFFCVLSHAESGRLDYDLDDDGLIEINDLSDLNEIRNNLDGTSLYASSAGCPVSGCNGFELTTDLDFDTNQDGKINELDEFWNDGKGWEPIGKFIDNQREHTFTADFNGNHFQIKNLYIDRQSEDNIGLFGFVRDSAFENIGLTGKLMFIRGRTYVGPLAGRVFHGLLQGHVKRTYSYGRIVGISSVGGLIGLLMEHSKLEAVFTDNDVSGVRFVGGIVGRSDLTKTKAVYSVSNVSGDRDVGGLIGSSTRGESILASFFAGSINKSGAPVELSGGLIGSDNFGESFDVIVSDSYWALDTSMVSESLGTTETTSYIGLQSQVLQCGVQANTSYQNSSCLSSNGADEGLSKPLTMYKDWDLLGQEVDGVWQHYWDFGSSDQLPALIFNNTLHRDSDGDLIWDEHDEFPLDFDNDGVDDQVDLYPRVSIGDLVDTDNDGAPNECDQACIDLGMTADSDDDNDGIVDVADAYPLISIGGLTDTDNDGAPNECDQACIDSGMTADSDDDNDGIADANDGYPLISIGALTDTDQDGSPNDCDQVCIDLGMVADSDDDNDGIADAADAYPLISIGELTDTDNDGSPNECDQACLDLGMIADTDDDNDGIVDESDDHPLISIGALTDTDQDGSPNDCDQACMDLGMIADIDDDNDGVVDAADAHPLISIVGLTDTDNDGAPNDCDQVCLDSGMTADSDDDNDGIADAADAHPLISIGVLIDTDQDGSPNDCDQACIDLGMIEDTDDDNDGIADAADVHPLISIGALIDTDNDGAPNECDQACADLGMTADSDDDNDGIADESDAHPLISIGALTDTDQDGSPNDCDQACLDLGMIADTDDDNDGIADAADAYPLISIGLLTDTDQDGSPNDCDQACLDLGMIADSDDDNDGIADDADAHPLISIVGLTDTDNDGAPNDCDQACLDSGMTADSDDDNDGITDASDDYPLISIGELTDTDNDGAPNECDQTCLESGMLADSDDDNDGIADAADAHPLISIGGLADTDQDGSPNDCDQACMDLGMVADSDDDNDGIADASDDYPLISIGQLTDTDNDGAPDECTQACLDLGMTADADDDGDGVTDEVDAFPLLLAAAIDDDLDGYPDQWYEACDLTCQSESGLVLDNQLNDTDNDGVTNDFDSDNTADNGVPELLSVPSDIEVAVTSEDGRFASVYMNEASLTAYDIVDDNITYQAYLNNRPINLPDDGYIDLPSGLNVIEWVAVDSSGNQSLSVSQIIKIYPQVKFLELESLTAEGGISKVAIELTGASPEYPVNILWSVEWLLSDTDELDFSESFDMYLNHDVQILEPAVGLPTAEIQVPIKLDEVIENDELIKLKLLDVISDNQLIEISEEYAQHSMVVTHDNLAPLVELKIYQEGVEVKVINPSAGPVSIKTFVEDANVEDQHSYEWDLTALDLTTQNEKDITFSPYGFGDGEFSISVSVADDGLPPKTSVKEIRLQVQSPSIEDQLGAMLWMFLLLPLVMYRRR